MERIVVRRTIEIRKLMMMMMTRLLFSFSISNRGFPWRGVLDGDGYLENRDGMGGDRMVITGSNDLLQQFEDFIKENISNSAITIKKIGNYSKLYVNSDTARRS
jgi:hypothetical protein